MTNNRLRLLGDNGKLPTGGIILPSALAPAVQAATQQFAQKIVSDLATLAMRGGGGPPRAINLADECRRMQMRQEEQLEKDPDWRPTPIQVFDVELMHVVAQWQERARELIEEGLRAAALQSGEGGA